MNLKNRFKRTISALIAILMIGTIFVPNMAKGASVEDNKLISTQFNVALNKIWKVNFNKEVDLDTINYDNVKIYDNFTDKAISISIIKDNSNYKSFQIKSSSNYTKGKSYRIEIMNIKTKENNKTMKPTRMDFYIKSIYSGLPGENGLVIIGDKAYAASYILNHSKDVNEIVLNNTYDIYFTNESNYEKLASILSDGILDVNNLTRKYDKMTYIDEQGKSNIYV
jgi:hypothetical protein